MCSHVELEEFSEKTKKEQQTNKKTNKKKQQRKNKQNKTKKKTHKKLIINKSSAEFFQSVIKVNMSMHYWYINSSWFV